MSAVEIAVWLEAAIYALLRAEEALLVAPADGVVVALGVLLEDALDAARAGALKSVA